MNEQKTNRVISFSVITLIFIIIFFGLFNRFSYENNSKKIYMSANYDDILSYDTDVLKNLKELKNAGVNFVTLKPVMLSDLENEKKVDIVTYSSLKINVDEGSKVIYEALGNKAYQDDSIVIISSDIPTTDFLKNNLSVRYKNVTEKQIYENVTVFLVDGKTKDDDLILGYDSTELKNAKDSGMKIALEYPSYTFENEEYGDYFASYILLNDIKFIVYRDYEKDNKIAPDEEFLKEMSKAKASLVVFENENQVRNEEPYGYKYWKTSFSGRILRGFNMDKAVEYDTTKYRYRYYQWYNSALERNTTFINVNILKNKDTNFKDNKNLTIKAVSELKKSMEKQGFSFEEDYFSKEYPSNMKLFAICGGALLIALILLYLALLQIKIPHLDIIGCFGAIVAILVSFAFYDYITRYYACLLSVLITSIFTLILFKIINSQRKYKLWEALGSFFAFVVFGSLVISAMFGDFAFFVGEKWVFGVKLTLTVPFLTTAYNYNVVFLKIKSIKEMWKKLKVELKKIPLYALITAGVLCIFVLGYFLIRTGKSSLILPFEDMMRKKLTDIFAIRPRTKEFLIGYPLFALFLYFSVFRKNKKGMFLCGILQTILFTSVLNTFSHAFTRYQTSFMRFLNGLFLGVLISAVIIGIIELIIFIKKKTLEKGEKEKEEKQIKTEKTNLKEKFIEKLNKLRVEKAEKVEKEVERVEKNPQKAEKQKEAVFVSNNNTQKKKKNNKKHKKGKKKKK